MILRSSLFFIVVFTVSASDFQGLWAVERTFASVPQTVSQVVGHVDKRPFTSRDVAWYDFIDQLVHSSKKSPKLISPDHPDFKSKAENFGLSHAIYLDAQQFSHPKPDSAEVNRIAQLVTREIVNQKIESFFRPTPEEINRWIETRLISAQFFKEKSMASAQPITDSEAKKYFDDHRSKYENSEFKKVKSAIKQKIANSHVEDRLRTWFDLLQEKYGYRDLVQ